MVSGFGTFANIRQRRANVPERPKLIPTSSGWRDLLGNLMWINVSRAILFGPKSVCNTKINMFKVK